MTIPEIQALKAELEVALLQAFTDFQRLTGVAVMAVDTTVYCGTHLEVTRVTVQLETL